MRLSVWGACAIFVALGCSDQDDATADPPDMMQDSAVPDAPRRTMDAAPFPDAKPEQDAGRDAPMSDAPADTSGDSPDGLDGGVDGGDAPRPDLVVTGITRNEFHYHVQYCNRGSAKGEDLFLVRIENVATGLGFTSNSLYPFPVPEVDECTQTGGFGCGLIGDVECGATIDVRALVDSNDTVEELDEANNTAVVAF